MRRAPWPVGPLFGVSLAIAILLVGPLLLFNPLFTSLLQARHEVAASFGTTQAAIDRVTTELLVDIYTDGDFDAMKPPPQSDIPFSSGLRPMLDERERSHMHDVAVLVRILGAVALLAVVVAGVTGVWLNREPRRQGLVMLLAGGGIGAIGLVVAVAFAVAFEPTFLAFHAIFFPPGTFLFEPGSNLIRLFPEPFWFDASLAAGATVLLAAAIVALIGLRRLRTGGPTPLPA